jgi:putative methylase
MKEIGSKKALEVMLSRLRGFKEAKVSEEQYTTPSAIAAEVLWKAFFNGDIEGKAVIDLGAGTGILGLGSLLLGAKKVFLVDKDKESIAVLEENLKVVRDLGKDLGEAFIVEKDAVEFGEKADTVIMNPPFGTKSKHADKEFLLKAFELADSIYSFHKTATEEYIVGLSERKGFRLAERFDFSFMLRNTMKHHRKKKEYIAVSCFALKRI